MAKLHSLTLRSLKPTPDPLHFIRRRDDRGDWLIRADVMDVLKNDPRRPLPFGVDDPDAELIKSGRERRVCRVRIGARTVVMKTFDPPRGWDAIRSWLTGTPAEREWRATRRAARLGAPTLTPLAVGVCGGPQRRSVFITEEFAGGRPLSETCGLLSETCGLSGPMSPFVFTPPARALVEAVASLYARAHDAGVFHRDAHPGNVLVRRNSGGSFDAVFADMYGARFASPLAVAAEVQALAQLDQFFHRTASTRTRLRFLLRYVDSRTRSAAERHEGTKGKEGTKAPRHQGTKGKEEGTAIRNPQSAIRNSPGRRFRGRPYSAFRIPHLSDPRRLAVAVQSERARLAARLARQRDRRLRRNGPYFTRIDLGGGWVAWVTLKLERRHVFPEAGVPDRSRRDWLDILTGVIARCGKEVAGAYEFQVPQAGLRVSGARPSALRQALVWRMTGLPGWLEYAASHQARHRDVPAPLVLAILERHVWGRVTEVVTLRPTQQTR